MRETPITNLGKLLPVFMEMAKKITSDPQNKSILYTNITDLFNNILVARYVPDKEQLYLCLQSDLTLFMGKENYILSNQERRQGHPRSKEAIKGVKQRDIHGETHVSTEPYTASGSASPPNITPKSTGSRKNSR